MPGSSDPVIAWTISDRPRQTRSVTARPDCELTPARRDASLPANIDRSDRDMQILDFLVILFVGLPLLLGRGIILSFANIFG